MIYFRMYKYTEMENRMRNGKKLRLLVAGLLLSAAMTAGIAGCGNSEAETTTKQITGADDLEGAKIGVQLGTTGDIYVSDYEGDEAGTTVERYNKGADAIQALKLGKIDCVVIDEQPAIEFVKKQWHPYRGGRIYTGRLCILCGKREHRAFSADE